MSAPARHARAARSWVVAAIAGLALSAGAQTAPVGEDRYACCNLRIEKGRITDGNWTRLPFVPAGTPIRLTGWGRYRALVAIDGKPAAVVVDHGHEQLTREQFADLVLLTADPRDRIAAWPAEVRAAIAAGKVRRGMTKEQVIVALGHPRRDRTPDPAAPSWIYFHSDAEEFDLDFDAAGRAVELHGNTRVRDAVWQDD